MPDDQTDTPSDGDDDAAPAPAQKKHRKPAHITAQVIVKPDGKCDVHLGKDVLYTDQSIYVAFREAKVAAIRAAVDADYTI